MKMIHTRKSDYNFKEMTDEQVVAIAQEEQNEFAIDYIVNKYKNFVRAKARSYFLVGADREDIIQEGMIGLYKATRDFKHDKLASFRAFAELCITSVRPVSLQITRYAPQYQSAVNTSSPGSV